MIPVIGNFLKAIERQKRVAIFLEALLLAFLVGFLDYVSGYEMSLFIFYGVPIMGVAWWCGRKSALVLALICAIIWWWVDEATGHPYAQVWLQAWEPGMRFGYFGFVAIAGSALRKQHDVVHSRIALLERSQRLERQIIGISEREQRRIGRDLHDGLCQYFAAVGFAAASLRSDLAQAGLTKEASVANELTELLEQGVIQTRELARGLVPVLVHEAGLSGALEQLTASVSHLQGVSCRFYTQADQVLQASSLSHHLYRIAQEAIHNAIRHGEATTIAVSLRIGDGEGALEVADNGKGISKSNGAAGGMGLHIMKYRARLIGGKWAMRDRGNGGTTVICTFPLSGERAS